MRTVGATLLTFMTLIGMSAPVLAQKGPPVVTVASPLARSVTQWDEYTGRFEASERVAVRARVSGYIEQVHFVDGADVKQGDLLFMIDRRPFEIAVDSARADLARAQAQVTLNQVDYQRAQELVKTAATTVRDLDTRKANLDTSQAQVMAAQAALRNAELNLEWTEVRAPISGRVSDRRVDPGNLVTGGQDNATALTTIVKLDPIYFVFEGSEADYIRYSRLSREGERPSSRAAPNPVRVQLADETGWPHPGHMDFVDNEVNTRSGTIRGRAVLDNHDLFLTPGTFGRLQLFGGTVDALLVPDEALVADQARKVLYTVGADNKIVSKPVTIGGYALGLRVITAGLQKTDRVVVDGLANPFVRPGAVVAPEAGEIKAPPGQTAAE
ncbi:MAG TPA: efflux RND transporter periplasmic adaptor subunit [Xanthobacteraceae bacterium]|nr:efflux RND transporter periplasmic adaptor subunit [Xanthobacteraceae bacterium]